MQAVTTQHIKGQFTSDLNIRNMLVCDQRRRFFVDLANPEGVKLYLISLVKLNNPISVRNFAPKIQVKTKKKKVSAQTHSISV